MDVYGTVNHIMGTCSPEDNTTVDVCRAVDNIVEVFSTVSYIVDTYSPVENIMGTYRTKWSQLNTSNTDELAGVVVFCLNGQRKMIKQKTRKTERVTFASISMFHSSKVSAERSVLDSSVCLFSSFLYSVSLHLKWLFGLSCIFLQIFLYRHGL